jgi:hypothetical protein
MPNFIKRGSGVDGAGGRFTEQQDKIFPIGPALAGQLAGQPKSTARPEKLEKPRTSEASSERPQSGNPLDHC